MPLYRYGGSLLRVAGGLAGHARCCCLQPTCCPDPPGELNWIFSSPGTCDLDGCSGTMLTEVPIAGCDQRWLQSTLDDPACIVGSLRLCCNEEDGYVATANVGLGFELITIPMTIVSCDPFSLTGTVAATVTGCTADLTLDITEP